MGLELRKSASFILSGGSSATPAVAASAELLMGAAIAISYGMDKIDRCAAPQRQRQCGSTRAAAKPAKCSRSYVGSRMCLHKLLRSMRTRGGQPQTAPHLYPLDVDPMIQIKVFIVFIERLICT